MGFIGLLHGPAFRFGVAGTIKAKKLKFYNIVKWAALLKFN